MSASALVGKTTTDAGVTGALYVGDLMAEVNETLLFEIFNAVGPVASVKVCRDKKTKKSLGYAYVNFHNIKDAERAIDCMNFTSIKGQTCRIMWVNRDKSVRDNGVGNIVVKNLDETIDNKMLYDTFSMFGSILSAKIGFDRETGEHLGYAFVHYADEESALKAIENINDMVLAGRKVVVEKYESRQQRAERSASNFTNIYVKNLDKTWTTEEIFEKLSEYGQVDSKLIPEGTGGDNNLTYCYCNYRTHEEAKRAVEGLNQTKGGDDSNIEAGRCLSKAEIKEQRKQMRVQSQNANLYVKNLPSHMSDETLKELFAVYGNVISCRIMRDRNGISKQFGFVNFENEGEASTCMAEMNGKDLNGLQLYVGLAQSKEERKQILAKKFAKPAVPTGPPAPFGMMPPSNMMRNPFPGSFGPGPMGFGIPRAPPMGMPMPPRPPMGMNPFDTSMMTPRAPPMMAQQRAPSIGNMRGGRRESLLETLAGKSVAQQKQIIGERLYSSIQRLEPKKAGKITGMLLEMEPTELLILVESEAELVKKVNEALIVLRQHNMN